MAPAMRQTGRAMPAEIIRRAFFVMDARRFIKLLSVKF
jgi:hypothetical protein